MVLARPRARLATLAMLAAAGCGGTIMGTPRGRPDRLRVEVAAGKVQYGNTICVFVHGNWQHANRALAYHPPPEYFRGALFESVRSALGREGAFVPARAPCEVVDGCRNADLRLEVEVGPARPGLELFGRGYVVDLPSTWRLRSALGEPLLEVEVLGHGEGRGVGSDVHRTVTEMALRDAVLQGVSALSAFAGGDQAARLAFAPRTPPRAKLEAELDTRRELPAMACYQASREGTAGGELAASRIAAAVTAADARTVGAWLESRSVRGALRATLRERYRAAALAAAAGEPRLARLVDLDAGCARAAAGEVLAQAGVVSGGMARWTITTEAGIPLAFERRPPDAPGAVGDDTLVAPLPGGGFLVLLELRPCG